MHIILARRAGRLRPGAARGQLHSRAQATAETDRVDRGEGPRAPPDPAQGLQPRAGRDPLSQAGLTARHLRRRSAPRQGKWRYLLVCSAGNCRLLLMDMNFITSALSGYCWTFVWTSFEGNWNLMLGSTSLQAVFWILGHIA